MKIIITIFVALLASVNCYSSSNSTLIGTVVLGEENIYNITIQYNDTTQKAISTAFEKRNFEMEIPKGEAMLIIKSEKHNDFRLQINVTDSILNIGKITLIPLNNIMLNDIVVTAKKIQIENNGMNYSIRNIQGTYLAEAGSIMDMLKWTPGIFVINNNEINVAGKGSPIVYINDRKITSKVELEAIQSSDVQWIQVIKEPGANYKNGTNSVLRIYLKKKIKDYFGLNISETVSKRRLFNTNSSANLSWKEKRFSGIASFSYGRISNKTNENSNTLLYADNRSVTHQTLTDRWDKDSRNNYNIFAGLNYELSSKSNLRVQYSGEFKNGTENVNSTQTNSNPLEQISIHRTISADGTQDRYTNTASASYQLQRNMNSSLNLVADFTNRRINKYKSQAEQDMKNEPKYIILNNESDYNAYTFDGNYSFMIGKNSYETIGLSAGTLNNDSRSIEDEISQNIDRTNRYINMYATFSRDWGNFSTELGLRYEYDYTRTNYFSNIENNNIIKEYSNLYPSVSASYKFGKNRLTASYTRESFKPSFYEINPIKTYIDSLHYYMGNPELKPSYSNNYSFTFNISKVTLNFIYSHLDNGIRNAYYQEDTSPNIIIEKPENIGKSDYFKLSINYNYSIKGLNLYLQGQLSHSTSDYFYLGENIKEKQFNAMINWMASYNIKKKWNIFLNGWYISPKLASGMNMGHSLCTNFGASTSFFKKKLNITLAIYDIFNNMVSPSSVTIKSNNVYYHKKNDYDTRSLSLTVRYTFNTVKTKFKESSGNKDLLDRVIDK